jgi:hypothetical protein
MAAPAADPKPIRPGERHQSAPGLYVRRGRFGIGFVVCYGDEAVTPIFQDEAAAKYLCAY